MPEGAKKTLLLVEDEAMLAMCEKMALEQYGYAVKTVPTGEKAIETVNTSTDIDLVLMDINLGNGIDGTQAAELILKDHDVPIVFVSSHTEPDVVQKTENITSYGYVVKSSSITVLDASIKMAFKLFSAKQSILESEKRYAMSFSAVNDGLWDWNVLSGEAYFSEQYYSLLGYEDGEFPATYNSWRTLVHSDDIERVEVALKKSIESGEGFSIDLQMRLKNGEWLWVSTRGKAIEVDSAGIALRMIGTLSSITDRKLVEKLLQDSETRYRRLFESAQDGILILNSDTGRIVDVNPFLVDMLGYSKEQFIEKAIWDIGFLKDIISNKENFLELQNRKYVRYENLPLETSLGVSKNVEFVSNVYMVDGKMVIQCNIRDISDRKVLEDLAKNRVKEREVLLKEVHHRIKNNMNTISSLLSLQSHSIKEPQAIAALEDARGRVYSMGMLYDKLYRSVDFKEVSIKGYLPDLIDEIVGNFPNRHCIKVEKEIQEYILDAKRLQPIGIIINELLTNIMKYAFAGRTEGMIIVLATGENGHAVISVQDNGNGMPECVSFDNSTGFGLQLVHMLTQQINGTIRIERGNGTKVVLEFDI